MSRTGYRHAGRELDLTPRQRQVLDLIASGRTNPQIAESLGISLDGAKWHVGEVLARLNVSTREEAAERWRAYNAAPARVARLGAGIGAFLPHRWLAVSLGIGIVAVFAAVAFAISDSRGGSSAIDEPRVPTATIESSPTAVPGPLPSGDCPVDPAICSFASDREALLGARDYEALLTPSPFERSGDFGSFTAWLEATFPPFDGWRPEVVSIGCPVVSDADDPSCDDAFVLAFSTLHQVEHPLGGLGELLYRRESQDGTGRPELRSMERPTEADRTVIVSGGTTVSTRDFQVRDIFPGAVRVAWYSLDTSASPVPSPSDPVARPVTGLFDEPQPHPEPVTASVVIDPSPYPPYTEGEAVIYDTFTGRALPLGVGGLPVFNPDGLSAAYVASEAGTPGDITIVDLKTGAPRVVGQGRVVLWIDAQTIAIKGEGESWTHLNVETGASTPAAAPGNDAYAPTPRRQLPYVIQPLERIGRGLQGGGNSLTRWVIARDEIPALILEAYWVVPQSPASVVVATEPDPTTLATNLFSVDSSTGQATFLVSAIASSPNWPLSAFGSRVMWTDRYCPIVDEQTNRVLQPTGDTWLFDSATGVLTRLTGAELLAPGLVSDTHFAVGEFGHSAIVDVTTFTAGVVLPTAAEAWTADFRYAATGTVGGHGGLC